MQPSPLESHESSTSTGLIAPEDLLDESMWYSSISDESAANAELDCACGVRYLRKYEEK